MYREKYGKKTALIMYAQEKPRATVENMLVEEGASPEQVPGLAAKYYQTYLLMQIEDGRRQQKQAGMYITVGVVFAVGSIVLSGLSYLLIDDGGSYVAYYGVLAFGILAIVKGITDKQRAVKVGQQAQQALLSIHKSV
jgi:hypothetical protein